MKTFFTTFITLVLLSLGSLQAQDFSQAIGVRGGLASGITYKASIDGTNAFDLILSTRWSGFSLTALYERHTYPFSVEGLYAYYGAGGHVGFYDNRSPWFEGGNSGIILGADGVIGIEYTLADLPLAFSFDWKPVFNLVGHSGFNGSGFALSARYVID